MFAQNEENLGSDESFWFQVLIWRTRFSLSQEPVHFQDRGHTRTELLFSRTVTDYPSWESDRANSQPTDSELMCFRKWERINNLTDTNSKGNSTPVRHSFIHCICVSTHPMPVLRWVCVRKTDNSLHGTRCKRTMVSGLWGHRRGDTTAYFLKENTCYVRARARV